MLKRTTAIGLWFFAGWTVGNSLGYLAGSPGPFGLALGVLAAAFVALDPMRLMWVGAQPRKD